MNAISCPRCGHDHGAYWGDDTSKQVGNGTAQCHAKREEGVVAVGAFCPCALPLSSALRDLEATRTRSAVQDAASALDGMEGVLGRLGDTLDRMVDSLDLIADRSAR